VSFSSHFVCCGRRGLTVMVQRVSVIDNQLLWPSIHGLWPSWWSTHLLACDEHERVAPFKSSLGARRHSLPYPTILRRVDARAFGDSIVVPPDTKSWRRHCPSPLLFFPQIHIGGTGSAVSSPAGARRSPCSCKRTSTHSGLSTRISWQHFQSFMCTANDCFVDISSKKSPQCNFPQLFTGSIPLPPVNFVHAPEQTDRKTTAFQWGSGNSGCGR